MTRPAIGQVAPPALGVLLVVTVRYELWLLVAGFTAITTILARRHHHEVTRVVPALLAVRATSGSQPTDAASDAIDATELAVLADGRLEVLDRAAELAHRETDPDRWSIAIDRITRAHDVLGRRRVPGVRPERPAPLAPVVALGAVTGLSLAGAAITSSGWWLVPLLAAYSAAMVAWTDWRDQHTWRPMVVAAAARAVPQRRTDHSEQALVADLATISQGRHRCLRRARAMVEAWDGDPLRKDLAWQHLDLADRLIRRAGLERSRRTRTFATATATVLFSAAAAAITA